MGIWSNSDEETWTFTCPLCGVRQTQSAPAPASIRKRKGIGSAIFTLTLAAITVGLFLFHQQLVSWLSELGSTTASSSGPGSLGRSDSNVPNSAGGSGATTGPYCLIQPDGGADGVSLYHRVNTRTTAPCYSHWNLTVANGGLINFGRACGFYVNDQGPSAVPLNIWNIIKWGETPVPGTGQAVYTAWLHDGTVINLACVAISENAPQTTLISNDWG
ncbi:MAG: hypothetical protein EPN30_01935 [Actinomycetota bacterium]|nr:MAG: hypothetical protein EPN30_01935 [Actinomycetota bacterium]